MTDTKQTTSTAQEEAQTSDFKFPCGDFKEMFTMMKKCWNGGEDSFGCCAMMQQMCCDMSEEADKKKDSEKQ